MTLKLTSAHLRQTTDTLLMIRPANFGYNPQTAESNAFMENDPTMTRTDVRELARQEFDRSVEKLRAHNVKVVVFEENPEPYTPDSVFPNNWISFHENHQVITYPMLTPNRRAERRMDVVQWYLDKYPQARHLDLSPNEELGRILEGTGSMVFDRVNQIAYACYSPRTSPTLFAEFCTHMGLEGLGFTARDRYGQDIYHTNVMMALGTKLAIVCLQSIRNRKERERVVLRLKETGYTLVRISFEQMEAFAGNMLEVYNTEGEVLMVMSQQAHDSLTPAQLKCIGQFARPLPIDISTIETYGGGSVRCMMAEVFEPIDFGREQTGSTPVARELQA